MTPSSLSRLNSMCLLNLHTDESIAAWLFSAVNNTIISLSVPFIAICYLQINIMVKTSRQAVKSFGMKSKGTSFSISTTTLLIVSNIMCWIPVTIVALLIMLKVPLPSQVPGIVAGLLMPFNSVVNPILYTIKTTTFRSDILKWLAMMRKSCHVL